MNWHPGRRRRAGQYRRLLVLLDGSTESIRALAIACRLATDDHATITCLYVLEVPAVLPLESHLQDAEAEAYALLERAGATCDARGVKAVQVLVRARDAASAIVARATADDAEIVVLGVRDDELARRQSRVATATVRTVLESAPCRVLVVANPRPRPQFETVGESAAA